MIKTCKYCGEEFKTYNKRQKYCNNICYSKTRPLKIYIKNCLQCGKNFKTTENNRKYCGYKCSNTKRKTIVKKCLQCGEEFESYISINQKTCSRKCYHVYRKKPRIKLICGKCGRNYIVIISRNKSKYCSDKCSKIALKNRKNTWSDKISKALKGREIKQEWRKKISKTLTGRPRVPFTEENIKNIRESRIKYIEKCFNNGEPLTPCIGKNETKILNQIEKDENIKLIRQYPFRGYFIDGYDKENNIVYEVDEKYHLKQQQKDLRRQQEIIKYLGCEFVRIKDY